MKYPRLVAAACVVGAVLLLKDAAQASFLYTTQGDYCAKVVRNIGEQVDAREFLALQECIARSDSVYRPMLAEVLFGAMLVGAGLVVFLRQRKERKGIG